MFKPTLYLGDLDGPDGNAFVMLGRAAKVAKENDMDWDTIRQDATSGDYEHLKDVLRENFDAVVMSSINTEKL